MKLTWGILSTANIATKKVIPAMQQGHYSEIVGIASRDIRKAEQTAKSLGIPKAYGSYEALLAEPDIQAVYIPVPNHLHVPLSLQALQAGKHVLVEKPVGLNAAEAEELLQASRKSPHLKIMEAFMYRFHPQWQLARKMVADGELGEVRAIQTFFSYYNDNPGDVRNQAEIGGGGLLDVGCYPISLSRFIFGREPASVLGTMERDPKLKIDRLTNGTLDFGQAVATFTCSTQLFGYQRVNILGTKGRLELEIPFNAPNDRPCRIRHQEADHTHTIDLPVCDQYTLQGDQLSMSVLEDRPVPTPLEDALANMRVIDALARSAETHSQVALPSS